MRTSLRAPILLANLFCLSSLVAQNPTPPPKPLVEYIDGPSGAFLREKDPDKQLAMLDDYVAKYRPTTGALAYIYPLYIQIYSQKKYFPKILEYADKYLALDLQPDTGQRYQALYTWALAYNQMDSADRTLASKALERAREGAELIPKIEKPQSLDPKVAEEQVREVAIFFQATAAIAAMKLDNRDGAYHLMRAIAGVEPVRWPDPPQKTPPN